MWSLFRGGWELVRHWDEEEKLYGSEKNDHGFLIGLTLSLSPDANRLSVIDNSSSTVSDIPADLLSDLSMELTRKTFLVGTYVLCVHTCSYKT